MKPGRRSSFCNLLGLVGGHLSWRSLRSDADVRGRVHGRFAACRERYRRGGTFRRSNVDIDEFKVSNIGRRK